MKYLPLETHPAAHIGYQQRVKEDNIKRVFDLVRSGKCKSRAEIVRVMQLSATSVSGLVEELAARGLIFETGPQQTSQPGRRPISLRFNSEARQIAVFSAVGKGVRYSLLDLDCRVRESLFVPIDASRLSGQDIGSCYLAAFEDILENRAQQFNPGRAALVGISFCGHYIDGARALCQSTKQIVSIPESAIEAFQRHIGLPLCFANSTRCMAYAEKKRMDAENPDSPETQDLLFVSVGNSIGGALIINGNLYSTPNGLNGEVGHISIDYDGRPCPCGSKGCLERYVNLNAILADAQAACREAGTDAPASIADLAARCLQVPAVDASLDRSAELLATGLYSLICGCGLRRIVLGGGIEALGQGFLDKLRRAIGRRTLLIDGLDLSYAQAGPDADCVGLAQYFLDKVFTITL